ncbi:MAG: MFS transporter [Elusimicrobia bacterium]|nr:MFS transporter [Elusimicrobiota bacterium]
MNPAQRRRQLAFLACYRSARSVAAGMISLAFPFLVLKDLHHSALTLGAIYAAACAAAAGQGLLIGVLSDVWSRTKTLWLAAVVLPLSAAVVCCSTSLWALFLAAILGGYSATGSLMGGGVGGAAQPVQNAVLTDLSVSESRTKFFSWFMFLSGAAAAAGTLLTRLVSVRGAFWAAAAISGIGLIFLIPLRLPPPGGRLGQLKSVRVLGQFSITGALNGLSQGLITPFLVPFFILVFHVSAKRMSVYGFISGSLGALAILAGPALGRRLGFVRSIAWTRGVGAALLILMPIIRILPFDLLVYFLTPTLRIAAVPVQKNAMAGMVDRTELGRVFGWNQVSRLAASAGAIFFTGAMFGLADIGFPFYCYGAVMAVNIGLYFRFFGAGEAAAAEAAA